MDHTLKKAPDEHECSKRTNSVFSAARESLDGALAYLDSTDTHNTTRLRLALGAIAIACDALKAAANGHATMLNHVSRGGL
jgi:hypothetical protein